MVETNSIGSQEFMVEVWDADEPDLLDLKAQDLIGTATFHLKDAFVGTFRLNLERDGKLVTSKSLSRAELTVTIQEYAQHPTKALVSLETTHQHKFDAQIQFVQITSQNKSLQRFDHPGLKFERDLVVYQTPASTQSYPIFEINEDHLYCKNLYNPSAAPADSTVAPSAAFTIISTDDIEDKQFEVRLIKYKDTMNTSIIGSCRLPASTTSLSTRESAGNVITNHFVNPDPKKKGEVVGSFSIKSWVSHPKSPSYADFVAAGLTFQLSFAIDCSGSGSKDAQGLHKLNSDGQNLYTWALRDIGDGLTRTLGKDRISGIHSFAFGGPASNPLAINPFEHYSLSTKTQTISTIDDIIQQYSTFSKIPFPHSSAGTKTKFAPFLQYFNQNKVIVKEDIQRVTDWDGLQVSNPTYNILVILTDGEIDDKRETLDRLLDLSYKPVSVLFVGIGPDGNYIFKDLIPFNTETHGEGLLRLDKSLHVSRHMTHFLPYLYHVKSLEYVFIRLQRTIQRQVTQQFFAANKFPVRKL